MKLSAAQSRTIIRCLLFADGALLACALVPIFFPVSWMEYFHRRLGLGEFPDRPITIYLARSTSALYAVQGLLMLFVAWQYTRLSLLVPLIGWAHVVFGFVMLYIDLNASMPAYWTWLEGPPVSLVGLLLIWLYQYEK